MRGDPQYARFIYDDMKDAFESKLVSHLSYRGPWLLLEMLEIYLGTNDKSNVCGALSSPPSSSSSKHASLLSPRNHPPYGKWRIFDIGCGSGLVGKVFRHLTCTTAGAATAAGEESSGSTAMPVDSLSSSGCGAASNVISTIECARSPLGVGSENSASVEGSVTDDVDL